MKSKNLSDFLKKIVFGIGILFPFSLSVLLGTISLVTAGDWSFAFEDHTSDYYVFLFPFKHYGVGVVLFLIITGAVAFLLWRLKESIKKWGESKRGILALVAISFLLTLLPRLVFLLAFNGKIQPFSDYGVTWMLARGDYTYFDQYTFWPNYITYALYMRLISHLFGYSFQNILYVNMVWNAFSGMFIFLITKNISKSSFAGIIASLIYAFYPAGIIYLSCSSQEHICIAFLLMAVYFSILSVDTEKISTKFILAVIAGICAGASNSFKSFFPIVLIAFVITLILNLFGRKDCNKKQILILIGIVTTVIFSEKIANTIIVNTTEAVFDFEYDGGDVLPQFLSVGLNRQGEGQTNLGEINKHYTFQRMNGMGRDAAKEEIIDIVLSDWKGHWNEVPSFFVRKMIWAFQDDYAAIRTLFVSVENSDLSDSQNSVLNIIYEYYPVLTQLGYLAVMLAGTISLIAFGFRKGGVNKWFLFMSLISIGYFCLIVLSEAQSRYKCLVMPFIIVMISFLFARVEHEKRG